MDDNTLGSWRDRMAPIRRDRIDPPELERKNRTLAPGWLAFAYRLGIEPRCAAALFDWRGLLVLPSVLRQRAELAAEFTALRACIAAALPWLRAGARPPAPSDPASRLVRAPRPGAGMLGFAS